MIAGWTDANLIDAVKAFCESIAVLDADSYFIFDESMQIQKDGDYRMEVKFGSYNIRHGEDASYNMSLISKNITERQLDIIGLQEVDRGATRSQKIDTMKQLANATDYEYYEFFKAIPLGAGEYGLGILSRYPILETELIQLDSEGTNEQRILARAAIDVDGFTVQFFVTHLSYESEVTRERQFKQVNEILKQYDSFVLTGDFNTANFKEFEVIEGAAFVNNNDYSVPTFPQKMSAIDNIVYSKSVWSFEKPMNVRESYSDHYMLYATGIIYKKK